MRLALGTPGAVNPGAGRPLIRVPSVASEWPPVAGASAIEAAAATPLIAPLIKLPVAALREVVVASLGQIALGFEPDALGTDPQASP